MLTMGHEALLMLLRNRPALAPELLSGVLGVELPHYDDIRFESAALSDLEPAEYRADLVVVLERDGKPVLTIVVEVQLGRDAEKRDRWLAYLTGLRSRLGVPCLLLVIAPKRSVARWCAKRIEVGHPGFALKPLVVGPDGIPVVADAEQAKRVPEVAVLSAMAHGEGADALPVALAALAAASGLDDERAQLYADVVMASLNEAARRALEETMASEGYQYQSEFARRYVAQGEAKGRAEGRTEGEAKGRTEGEARGRAEGRASAVLTVLRARNIEVGPDAEQRILACTDLAELDEWTRRAVTVQSVDELFD